MALGTLGLALLTTTVLAAEGARIRPCAAGSPAAKSALRRIDKLDAQIRALGPEDSTKAAVKGLEALWEWRCFEATTIGFRDYETATPTSLQAWWSAGGEAWLRSMLELGAGSRTVIIPPDVRTGLVSKPGTAMSAVVCPHGETCPDSPGWQRRAQTALDVKSKAERARSAARWDDAGPDRAACAQRLAEAPADGKYAALRACWEETRLRSPTLPVGQVRLPREGWLVMKGRRGHYDFCDEVRAYSLATGAAFIARSCSGLVLIPGGHVDPKQTDAGRSTHLASGTISVSALREAVVMLIIRESVDRQVQLEAERLPLPEGVSPEWKKEQNLSGGLSGSLWFHSGQTRLSWLFRVPSLVDSTGDLTWPDASDVAEAVAAEWVREVEGTFVEGCPPEALPTSLLGVAPAPRVNARDAPVGVTDVQESLEKQLVAYVPRCEAAPSP